MRTLRKPSTRSMIASRSFEGGSIEKQRRLYRDAAKPLSASRSRRPLESPYEILNSARGARPLRSGLEAALRRRVANAPLGHSLSIERGLAGAGNSHASP